MTALQHPYDLADGGEWLRGNLHAHTTLSDGRCNPADVIADYARRGYDFLMISDHDRLPSERELASWATSGITLLRGNEISAQGAHILHVNGSDFVRPVRERQAVLDLIALDRESFAIMCHPNWLVCDGASRDDWSAWRDHACIEDLMCWSGYAGIEIFNGVTHRLDGSATATDKWDRLLAAGRKVWGFANDDSHRSDEASGGNTAVKPDPTPLMTSDVGLGWNVAWARRNSESIADSLREGRFYASTGQRISSIQVQGNTIQIEAPGAARIVAIRETGRRFAQGDGPLWEVEAPMDATYIRIECYGQGGAIAWTQPFWPGKGA
jgi:hypothetical protein